MGKELEKTIESAKEFSKCEHDWKYDSKTLHFNVFVCSKCKGKLNEPRRSHC